MNVTFENDAAALAAVEALTGAVLPVRYRPRFYAALAAPHCVVACARRRDDGALVGALTARFELDQPAEAFVRECTASADDDTADDTRPTPPPLSAIDDVLMRLLTSLLHWFAPPPPLPPRPKRLYLLTLAVRDDARRARVGSRLVEAALAWAREQPLAGACPTAALHVKADNAAALAFYARLGFLQTGPTLLDYYVIDGNRCDGLYLSRPLFASADSVAIAVPAAAALAPPPPLPPPAVVGVVAQEVTLLAWLRSWLS